MRFGRGKSSVWGKKKKSSVYERVAAQINFKYYYIFIQFW